MPSALVAPLSGMMADRFNRKRIMIVGGLLGGEFTRPWPKAKGR